MYKSSIELELRNNKGINLQNRKVEQGLSRSSKNLNVQMRCVSLDTQVTMENNETKRIDSLKIGEIVSDGFGGSCTIADIISGNEEMIWRFETSSRKFTKVTPEHTMILENYMKPAREVRIGDKLKTVDGFEEVVMIEESVYNDLVYNLIFEPSQTFVAGGIVVGDAYKQDTIKETVEYQK